MRTTFEAVRILRGRFDCVVVSPDAGTANAFANAMLATADAVLVSVAKGRRAVAADQRLAGELQRAGSRFLGPVTIDPAIVATTSAPRLSASRPPSLERRTSKPGLLARIFDAALRRLRGNRGAQSALQNALSQAATPNTRAAVLPSPSEPIFLAPGSSAASRENIGPAYAVTAYEPDDRAAAQ